MSLSEHIVLFVLVIRKLEVFPAKTFRKWSGSPPILDVAPSSRPGPGPRLLGVSERAPPVRAGGAPRQSGTGCAPHDRAIPAPTPTHPSRVRRGPSVRRTVNGCGKGPPCQRLRRARV